MATISDYITQWQYNNARNAGDIDASFVLEWMSQGFMEIYQEVQSCIGGYIQSANMNLYGWGGNGVEFTGKVQEVYSVDIKINISNPSWIEDEKLLLNKFKEEDEISYIHITGYNTSTNTCTYVLGQDTSTTKQAPYFGAKHTGIYQLNKRDGKTTKLREVSTIAVPKCSEREFFIAGNKVYSGTYDGMQFLEVHHTPEFKDSLSGTDTVEGFLNDVMPTLLRYCTWQNAITCRDANVLMFKQDYEQSKMNLLTYLSDVYEGPTEYRLPNLKHLMN